MKSEDEIRERIKNLTTSLQVASLDDDRNAIYHYRREIKLLKWVLDD